MKRKFILLSLLGSLYTYAQQDSFEYNGALSSNGWSSHGGTLAQLVTLTSASDAGNSLYYPGMVPSKGNRALITSAQSEDVNLAFTEDVTTTAFASFLMKVVDNSTMSAHTLNTAPGYFLHFSPFSGEDIGSTGIVSRLSVRKGSSASTFNLGILNTTGGSASLTDIYGSTTPVEYQVGTTYLVVLKYDMTGTTGQTTIWINPTAASEATPTHSSAFGNSNKLTQVGSLAFRQAATSGSIEIDEVRLGKTWSEVVGSAFLATGDIKTNRTPLISNTLVKDGFTVLTKKQARIQIYTVSGNLVKDEVFAPNSRVNVSNLNAGQYILRIAEGDNVSTVKIIKQ